MAKKRLGPKRTTAAEANERNLQCKYGHVGLWQDDTRNGPRKTSRRCSQCLRDRAREATYGLSPEAYAQLKSEFPVCAICGSDGKDVGRGSLEIDHSHQTGDIRGLLCRTCNIFLGFYEQYKHLIPDLERYLGAK